MWMWTATRLQWRNMTRGKSRRMTRRKLWVGWVLHQASTPHRLRSRRAPGRTRGVLNRRRRMNPRPGCWISCRTRSPKRPGGSPREGAMLLVTWSFRAWNVPLRIFPVRTFPVRTFPVRTFPLRIVSLRTFLLWILHRINIKGPRVGLPLCFPLHPVHPGPMRRLRRPFPAGPLVHGYDIRPGRAKGA